MNISYDYYKIFYYVAKYGSFTQAANTMLLNQPNLTRTVKQLEAQLGCTLFERSKKGVTLTSEGKALYEQLAIAFEHIKEGEDRVLQYKALQSGSVSIGATEISLRCYLLPILNEYRKKYPSIKIKISNLSTTQAITALRNGTVDFAVVSSPIEYEESINFKQVHTFKDTAICGEAYKEVLTETSVSLKTLSKYPLISLCKGCAGYRFYSDIFEKSDLPFSPEVEAATADLIIPLVRHNLGIGFVPTDFLTEEPVGIFKIKLSDTLPNRSIYTATLAGRTEKPPTKALMEMLI